MSVFSHSFQLSNVQLKERNNMKMHAETQRFILREIELTDVDGMFELDSNPEVHKYLGNKTVSSKEEMLKVIAFIRQQYVENGIGRWAIIDKENNAFVGWSGLKFVTENTNNHQNYYDLGYRLIPKYWGKGIATETATASVEYAFNELDCKEIFAIADVDNIGSNQILQKVGLKFIETFDEKGIEHNWYRLSKADYFKLKLICKQI